MSKCVLYVAAALGMLALAMVMTHRTSAVRHADAGMTHTVNAQTVSAPIVSVMADADHDRTRKLLVAYIDNTNPDIRYA